MWLETAKRAHPPLTRIIGFEGEPFQVRGENGEKGGGRLKSDPNNTSHGDNYVSGPM